VVSLNLAHPV